MPKIKEIIAVAFVILMAAVTVCICSSGNAQNYDGTWVGSTSYNGDVEFHVSGNNITRFSISVKEVPVDLFDKTTGSKNGTANSSTKYTCNAHGQYYPQAKRNTHLFKDRFEALGCAFILRRQRLLGYLHLRFG